eukprot:14220954-Heterocapsa_arctica.AAC.1
MAQLLAASASSSQVDPRQDQRVRATPVGAGLRHFQTRPGQSRSRILSFSPPMLRGGNFLRTLGSGELAG